jgi:anthranilate phosphoribosyltransferase
LQVDDDWRQRTAPLISKVVRGELLTISESEEVFFQTSRADAEGYYYLAFISALMARGVAEQELLGIVKALQRFARVIDPSQTPGNATDVSGTGGGVLRTFNISTASAMVVAAAEIPVAKQAYRAVSGLLGSADILTRVGVALPEDSASVVTVLNKVGIAPVEYATFFPGMEVRLQAMQRIRQLGLRLPTPSHLVAVVPSPIRLATRTYGMFTDRHLETVARIFVDLGCRRGMVFCGDGIPEITTVGETKVVEFAPDSIRKYVLTPRALGLAAARPEDLEMDSEAHSIRTFLGVVSGVMKGAAHDIVAANAGASLYVNGVAASISDGVDHAGAILESGRALEKLKQLAFSTAGFAGLDRLNGLLSSL